jgi:glutathione S-transferase
MYRLFSVEHSIFSAKVRSYLRFKHDQGDLGEGFQDILATPELINGLLTKRSGSPSLPQMAAPDRSWIQDSSEIIDYCEAAHTKTSVVPQTPKQRLAVYLVELLADEWLVVPACWERWFYSKPAQRPNHRAFNEQQWGSFLAPGRNGAARRSAGAQFFDKAFGINDTDKDLKGPYAGLIQLGCNQDTQEAWQACLDRLLSLLETHLQSHDYLLGGCPSLADFSLLGPIYVHFFRDPVPGFDLRTQYPLVAEWVERTNAENCLNARRYGHKYYGLDANGELEERQVLSDGGAWLEADEVPETLEPILAMFFDEMWPYLKTSIDALKIHLSSDGHSPGDELPRKTFTATPGFEALQTGDGPLTVPFVIGGIPSRRMVVPYQIWMLQRLDAAMTNPAEGQLEPWLNRFNGGKELLSLKARLRSCTIEKRGGLLFSESA